MVSRTKAESCLSPLVSHCPQCGGLRRVFLTIPVDDPGDIYRDKARVSLAARRAIDKDMARNDADRPHGLGVMAR
jgi:hypothetical protein